MQRLSQYQKWRCVKRNVEPGDIVLILDREAPKGSFTLGEIIKVKTDTDNIVRKVTLRYKIKNAGKGEMYVPTAYKYVERNVRGLALVVTAEERNKNEENKLIEVQNPLEEHDDHFDDVGTDFKTPEVIDRIKNDVKDPIFENNSKEETSIFDVKTSKSLEGAVKPSDVDAALEVDEGDRVGSGEDSLPPTSSGRRRRRPQRYGSC